MGVIGRLPIPSSSCWLTSTFTFRFFFFFLLLELVPVEAVVPVVAWVLFWHFTWLCFDTSLVINWPATIINQFMQEGSQFIESYHQ